MTVSANDNATIRGTEKDIDKEKRQPKLAFKSLLMYPFEQKWLIFFEVAYSEKREHALQKGKHYLLESDEPHPSVSVLVDYMPMI